jgi:hypothetical protein
MELKISEIEAMNYETTKYSLSGEVSYAGWFGLSGNWQNEKVTVTTQKLTCIVSNNSCDGPCYIYQKRPYEQRYTITAKEITINGTPTWVYCEPCNANVVTLLKGASGVTASEQHNEYEPTLKNTSDACNRYSQ